MAKLRRDQTLLLWATAASLALWLIPGVRILVYPLALLNTHLHELFHALAALITGGSVSHIRVFGNTSGVAEIRGGFLPLVASAGYVGASLYGGFLIWLGRSQESAKGGLILTGGLVAASLIAFVRGDLVGILSALAWAALLLGGQTLLKKEGACFGVQFLGIQQCLTSAVAFLALFDVSLVRGHSDALLMEQASGVPSFVWACVWLVLSLSLSFLCLRASWNGERSGRSSSS